MMMVMLVMIVDVKLGGGDHDNVMKMIRYIVKQTR